MLHRRQANEAQRMTSLPKNMRIKIQHDLIEVLLNIKLHAQTTDPFFVCGQYYPMRKDLILTMIDLGIGFIDY